MSLMTCPDCGKEISSDAPTCPQCGRPIKGLPKPKGEGCFLRTLNIGCVIVLVFVGLIIILTAIIMSLRQQ